jgi:hypothetical protein
VLEGAAKPRGGYAKPWGAPDPLLNFIDAMVGMFEAPWTPVDARTRVSEIGDYFAVSANNGRNA